MKHLRTHEIAPHVPSFEAPHTVTLSLQDWLGIQTQLGFAACLNQERGDTATAAYQRELLERLTDQTMTAIEAAAEQEGE